jgi:Poly(hydroxyalcanoate) granule associated protein (phasin)
MPKMEGARASRRRSEAPAYQIWLAGLGARAAAEKEDPKLFRRLVARGREVAEGEASKRVVLRSARGNVELPGEFQAPGRVVPAPGPAAETAQLRRNADARRAFLAEFGTLTSREVAEFAGSRAKNRAALANRWKAAGQIFAVEAGGQTLFPAFQCSRNDGQPRPVIAEILAALQPRFSGWQTALWFTGRNGWLGSRRPVEVLEAEPGAAAEAARRETEAFD